jgi:hypothetical protein
MNEFGLVKLGCTSLQMSDELKIVGYVRYLGEYTNLDPWAKPKIADWRTRPIYYVPPETPVCSMVVVAKSLGLRSSRYTGTSGWNIEKLLSFDFDHSNAAVGKFLEEHGQHCSQCWNAFWTTCAHYDEIEAKRNTTFSGRWWTQVAKDTVGGIAFLWWRDRQARRRR